MIDQVVVLAGGLGARMRPRTERMPKVLLEVAGRPFVEWLLERIVACGIHDVVFCVGYLGEQIRAFVADGARFGVNVLWVDEGADLRGTGGAVALAARRGLLDEAFVVTYGDSWLPFDYREPLLKLRERPELDAVMAVFHNASRWDASNVALTSDGDCVARYHKGSPDRDMQYIDYGATAFRRTCFETQPEDARFGLDEIQNNLSAAGRLGAVIARERFYEIGSPEGMAELDQRLRHVGRVGRVTSGGT